MIVETGVAGFPIAHSLSPVIHSAWITAAGLDARYTRYGPESPDAFAALMAHGRAGDIRGLNVTAPYKEQAFAAADEPTQAAKLVASANLLIFENGRVRADSTDGAGLMGALAEQAPALNVFGQAVVILGAGGAARAAAGVLASEGAAVRIVNRSRDRAERLAADIGPSVIVTTVPEAFEDAVLLINASSVPPDLDLSLLASGTVVMDMSYRPVITPLLAQARSQGLPIVDGLAMLIGQARPSFEALFGVPVPDIDVRALVLRQLGEGI